MRVGRIKNRKAGLSLGGLTHKRKDVILALSGREARNWTHPGLLSMATERPLEYPAGVFHFSGVAWQKNHGITLLHPVMHADMVQHGINYGPWRCGVTVACASLVNVRV